MGKYSGASDVKVSGGKSAFVSSVLGRHLLEVESVRDGENHDGVPFFAVDFKVVTSESEDPEMKAFKEGQKVVQLATKQTFKGAREIYFREIKAVAGAVAGYDDPSDATEEDLDRAVSEEQPFTGVVVEAEVYQHKYTIKNKNNPRCGQQNVINKVKFTYLGKDLDEALANVEA